MPKHPLDLKNELREAQCELESAASFIRRNEKLLLAAPEMLELLKRIIELGVYEYEGTGWLINGGTHRQIVPLIQKIDPTWIEPKEDDYA